MGRAAFPDIGCLFRMVIVKYDPGRAHNIFIEKGSADKKNIMKDPILH